MLSYSFSGLKGFVVFLLMLYAFNDSTAQNFDLSIQRGLSCIGPNYSSFFRSNCQLYEFGLYHYASSNNKQNQEIKLGFSIGRFATTRSVLNKNNESLEIPSYFNMIEIPFLFKGVLFRPDKQSKKAPHFIYITGLHMNILWNDRASSDIDWEGVDLMRFGASFAVQYCIEENKGFSQYIGPSIRVISLGNETTKYAYTFGLKIDWRFNY
ncbi:MAG: hypothetical protein JXQ87_07925 [Bacteroidia bacterium]